MAVVILPKSLTAKTEAKASDVMADFNAIVAQVNGKLDLENLAESLRSALIPTGSVIATARSSAPTGFLLCQGQAVSRATYAVLFAAIGGTFGAGDGTTTFNLPDLRGRTVCGPDPGGLRMFSFVNLGQAGGNSRLQGHTHSAGSLGTSVESNNHTHSIPGFPNTRHEGSGFGYPNWEGSGAVGFATDTVSAFHTHAIVGSTGLTGEGGSENMPPYQILNWMIKI